MDLSESIKERYLYDTHFKSSHITRTLQTFEANQMSVA
jgi:hypothetical protein